MTDVMLQDWTPMSRCLDWRIGRIAWNAQGGRLFADGDVPNLAHDSGTHSRQCAALFVAWCDAAAAAGKLPETLVIVEYAMGTGLFMRYLLDALRELCQQKGADYYDRLLVYATDVSAPMLRAVRDRGLLADHADKVKLGFADILVPGSFVALEGGEKTEISGQPHAAFCNYAIDLMPIDIFRRLPGDNGSRKWEAVLVRTWLRDSDALSGFTDLTAEQIQTLVTQDDPPSIAALGPLYSLLQTELRTFPFDVQSHPDHARIEAYADHLEQRLGDGHELLQEGTVVYHSGGAIEAAERVTECLSEEGFALFRDVGLHTPELAAVARTYQHFGPTVAAALNAIEFDHYFDHEPRSGGRCLGPGQDGVRDQVVRVTQRGELPIEAAFKQIFDGQQAAAATELVARARSEEDPQKALELYREALVGQPHDWTLMVEAAARVLSGGLDPQLAVVIAAKGLQLNTEHSADLWTVYGDAVWATGDRAAAQKAYEFALQVHPRHARAHYGAGYCAAENGRFEVAFTHIGQALAHDLDGAIRTDVLQLLDVCLRGQRKARDAFWRRMSDKASR